MLSLVSAFFLFSVNIWTHGSVSTKWDGKTEVFQVYFKSTGFMTTDNCWRRDTRISTSSWGKVWITCLSVHSYVWTSNRQRVAPHSSSPSCQGYEEKHWGNAATWQREGKQQKHFWWQNANLKEISVQHCCSLLIFLFSFIFPSLCI